MSDLPPWERPNPIDRSAWSHGMWDAEPDAAWWQIDEHAIGYIRRGDYNGAWCWYLIMLPGHPAWGVDVSAVEDASASMDWQAMHADTGTWWIGGDGGHLWNAYPTSPYDGHYVNEREARENVANAARAASGLDADAIRAAREYAVASCRRQAGCYTSGSAFDTHNRKKLTAAADAVAALLEVPHG